MTHQSSLLKFLCRCRDATGIGCDQCLYSNGRRFVYVRWLGWKYRSGLAVTRHRNGMTGEKVNGGLVSFGLGYVECWW